MWKLDIFNLISESKICDNDGAIKHRIIPLYMVFFSSVLSIMRETLFLSVGAGGSRVEVESGFGFVALLKTKYSKPGGFSGLRLT